MVLVAAPNPYSALTVRLASFAEIAAMASSADGYTSEATAAQRARPRISSVRQAFWKLPHHALLIRKSGGPPPDRDSRTHFSRADLWFYGPGKDAGTQEREAYTFYRLVVPAFTAASGESFVAAGCRVDTIQQEAEPIPFVDQEGGWRVMVAPVVMTWIEVPVS